jgi:hypothetical protein
MGLTYLIKLFHIVSEFKYIDTEQFNSAVRFLTCIREILGSNLGRDIGSLTQIFLQFLGFLRNILEQNLHHVTAASFQILSNL